MCPPAMAAVECSETVNMLKHTIFQSLFKNINKTKGLPLENMPSLKYLIAETKVT